MKAESHDDPSITETLKAPFLIRTVSVSPEVDPDTAGVLVSAAIQHLAGRSSYDFISAVRKGSTVFNPVSRSNNHLEK